MSPPEPKDGDAVWLVQADVAPDAEGNPASARYGDVYASRSGAAGQARAVFLTGCGLLGQQPAWAGRDRFTVLETGFGLGTNFFATWAAWRADPQRSARLHYVSFERHPVPPDALRTYAAAEHASLADAAAAQWPPPLRGLHSLVFDNGAVRLLLAFGDAATLTRKMRLQADALYLDGFAPARNPDLWRPELMRALARLCRVGARAATYTVARPVRDGLDQAGFQVARKPGWGGKRDRLEAVFAPRWAKTDAADADRAERAERRVIVVGAGIAGAACARAFAERGWNVDVLDAAERPATIGTGMPGGLAHVQLSADDNHLSRLTRAGMAALRRALPPGRDDLTLPGGVMMTPADDAEAVRMQAWRDTLRLPPDTARWLDDGAAASALGLPRAGPGWLVDGAVLANAPLCAAWLDHPRIRVRCNTPVAAMRREGDRWALRGVGGGTLATAPWLILASAAGTPGLLAASGLLPGADWMPLRAFRGQAQLLPARLLPALRGLRRGWMGPGYVLPLPPAAVAALPEPLRAEPDWLLIGATYEPPHTPWTAAAAWSHNRGGIAPLAGPASNEPPPLGLHSLAGLRAVTPDRLPYCGALPDLAAFAAQAPSDGGAHPWSGKRPAELPRVPGLLVCAGMGSRGLTLSALMAELMAAMAEGEPLPLESDLADAVDPARMALKTLRKTPSGG